MRADDQHEKFEIEYDFLAIFAILFCEASRKAEAKMFVDQLMDHCPCDIDRVKHRVPLRKSFDMLVYLSTKFIIHFAEAQKVITE